MQQKSLIQKQVSQRVLVFIDLTLYTHNLSVKLLQLLLTLSVFGLSHLLLILFLAFVIIILSDEGH